MHRSTSHESFSHRYGPWALVAGASEGIGRAFAWELARRGLSLVLVARRQGPLDTLAQDLQARFGTRVLPLSLDLAATDAAPRLDAALADLELGLLVVSAGYSISGNFLEVDIEEHERTLDLNCRAPLHLAHRFGRRLADRGRGGIILLSSLSALQGTPTFASYAAAKSCVQVLAEGLWHELRPRGVDVLACVPGVTRTPAFAQSGARSLAFSGSLAPEAVAREALMQLGRAPIAIPGLRNRLFAAGARFLSRARLVATTNALARLTYGDR